MGGPVLQSHTEWTAVLSSPCQ